MRSRRILRLISKKLDGDLTGREQRQLDRALERDADAYRIASEFEAIGDAFDALDALEPRSGFTGRTLARLDNVAQGSSWWTSFITALRPVPLTAAAAALLFGIALAVSMNGHATSSATSSNQPNLLYSELFDLTPFDGAEDPFTQMIDDTEQ